MDKWEYLTTFVEADIEAEEAALYMDQADLSNVPRYTPAAMMPALNRLGEKGWELVHMQPFFVGRNHDVLMHEGGGMKRWTNQYFCVFKRKA